MLLFVTDCDCPQLKGGREAWVVTGAGVTMEERETEEALPQMAGLGAGAVFLVLTQLNSARVLSLAWWFLGGGPGPAVSASAGSLLETQSLPPSQVRWGERSGRRTLHDF